MIVCVRDRIQASWKTVNVGVCGVFGYACVSVGVRVRVEVTGAVCVKGVAWIVML